MSTREPSTGRILLGTASVALTCPADLTPWFPGMLAGPTAGSGIKSVEILRLADGFAVATGLGERSPPLALGDAIAQAWERIAFLLCDGLSGAAAIHSAAVARGGGVVLLPGASGAGKTRLALWFRTRGFDLGTDELAAIAVDADTSRPPVISALSRPVMVKGQVDLAGLLRPGEAAAAEVGSATGRLVGLETGWSRMDAERTLFVFPRFSAERPLSLEPLSQAQTALRLLGNCVNLRNLPRGGLGLAAAIAQRSDAVALDYGDARQLDGTLDALTDRALATRLAREEMEDLCAALAAQASSAPAIIKTQARAQLPTPAVLPAPRRLTVGMATYDDYDGAYFTVQALRTYHSELRDDVEIVIVDNNPDGVCAEPLRRLMEATEGGRYVARGEWTSTAIRNAVFEEAGSPNVVCLDSHVFLAPGSLVALLKLLESDEHRRDLIQGPLVHDDLKTLATHMDPVWSGGMYGVWGDDPRGADPDGPAFDISIQGLGLFAARRDAWAGFNPRFRGFGGEEFYIHEKTRQRGGRTLCLPRLRWLHRFNRPLGVPYPNRWEDRMRNYLIGFYELGLPTAEMENHFAGLLGADVSAGIFAAIRRDLVTSG